MDQVNFFDGRYIYESEMAELQANMEKSVSNLMPEFWSRVTSGFVLSVSENIIKLTKGTAVGVTGENIFLDTDFEFAIPKITIANATLHVGISSLKLPVGEMTNPENEKVPASYKDSCQVYVKVRNNDDGEETILFPEEAEKTLAQAVPQFKTPQESILYFEKMKKTGLSYASELKSKMMLSIMWREQLTKKGENWTLDVFNRYVQDQIAGWKQEQIGKKAGAIKTHFIPNDRIAYMVEKIQSQTRWRIVNGQAMPEESVLKALGENHVIDLKNQFIRVWDEVQAVGRRQEDAMQAFSYNVDNSFYTWHEANALYLVAHSKNVKNEGRYGIGGPKAGGTWEEWGIGKQGFSVNINTSVTNTSARTAEETRPANVMLPLFMLT